MLLGLQVTLSRPGAEDIGGVRRGVNFLRLTQEILGSPISGELPMAIVRGYMPRQAACYVLNTEDVTKCS